MIFRPINRQPLAIRSIFNFVILHLFIFCHRKTLGERTGFHTPKPSGFGEKPVSARTTIILLFSTRILKAKIIVNSLKSIANTRIKRMIYLIRSILGRDYFGILIYLFNTTIFKHNQPLK